MIVVKCGIHAVFHTIVKSAELPRSSHALRMSWLQASAAWLIAVLNATSICAQMENLNSHAEYNGTIPAEGRAGQHSLVMHRH